MSWCYAGLAATLVLSACGPADRLAPGYGKPNYEANSLEGQPVSLAALRGSPVLLNVWATWCTPCREEMPYLSDLQEVEASHGLRVVGVSVDSANDRSKVAELAARLELTYEIWLDPDERIAALLGNSGVPLSVLIDRQGAVRWKHVGVLRETTPGFRDALREIVSTPNAR